MFFSKAAEPKIATQTYNIMIVGTSGIGLFLADTLKNAGHNITLLCSPRQADEYNATDFIFKDANRLKSTRNTFSFTHEITTTPQIVLIASSQKAQIAETALLNPNKLNESIIINLGLPYNNNSTLSEILHRPVISAFFDGHINTHKNHISILGNTPRLTFTLQDTAPEASLLKNIFQNLDIQTVFSENESDNLWSFFGPKLAHDILSATHNQNIFEIGKTDAGRKQIDAVLTEISLLATTENTFLTTADLLTKLYNYPPAYVAPLQKHTLQKNPLFFSRLSQFLLLKGLKNHKKYPVLHQLMQDLYNKY